MTAPVRDDDAELVKRLNIDAAPKEGEPFAGKDRATLIAERREAADTIERLSRLSSTPETGLIEAFKRACCDMAKGYGLGSPESRAILSAVEHASLAHRATLANAAPAQPESE